MALLGASAGRESGSRSITTLAVPAPARHGRALLFTPNRDGDRTQTLLKKAPRAIVVALEPRPATLLGGVRRSGADRR